MNQTGFIVFTASPEMAKQTNRALRSGVTYVAQRATIAQVASGPVDQAITSKVASGPSKKTPKTPKTAKKTPKTAKKIVKKTSKKVSTKKTAVKAAATPKATNRKPVKPEAIIKFVVEHAGCNMTDIEGATKLPQGTIRRLLNEARDSGEITTSGQRRGLRYFAGADAEMAVSTGNDSVNADN